MLSEYVENKACFHSVSYIRYVFCCMILTKVTVAQRRNVDIVCSKFRPHRSRSMERTLGL